MEERRRHAPTVLIVDDETVTRNLVAKLLSREGYRTLTAKDGPEALQLYEMKKSEIDLTLLDATMPGMDGFETMLAIREIDPKAEFVLSSGFPEETFPQSNLSIAFLSKPYPLSDLMSVVTGALPKHGSASGPSP